MGYGGPDAVVAHMKDRARKATEKEDPIAIAARAEAAEKYFNKLDEATRCALKLAASQNPILLCALGEGRWNSAIRALMGMELHAQDERYKELARAVYDIIPNVLEAA